MIASEFKNHPFLVHAQAVQAIAEPFFKAFGISHFSNIRYYYSGHFTGLMSDANWGEVYLSKQHFNHDVHFRHSNTLYTGLNMWDAKRRSPLEEKIFNSIQDFNLGEGFTVVEKQKTYCDLFHFCSNSNKQIKQFYSQNLETLKFFIAYFKNRISHDRILSQALQQHYSLEKPNEIILSPRIAYEQKIKNFTDKIAFVDKLLIAHQQHLTKRELECIHLHARGYSMQELSQMLNITPRTAYEHLRNIKEKLQCYSKFQLGEKLASLGISCFEQGDCHAA